MSSNCWRIDKVDFPTWLRQNPLDTPDRDSFDKVKLFTDLKFSTQEVNNLLSCKVKPLLFYQKIHLHDTKDKFKVVCSQ